MSESSKIPLVPDTQTSNEEVVLKKLAKEEKLTNASIQASPFPSQTDYGLIKNIESSQECRDILVEPLSNFGTFEIEPKIRELKWISDHTSGEVHKDIPTISMLFNQDLNLPEAAQKFIAQSPSLTNEAMWEKTKAIFYKLQPEKVRDRAFDVLSRLSVLAARRFIYSRTLSFQRELIIQPGEKYEFSSKDLETMDQVKMKELHDLDSIMGLQKTKLIAMEDRVKSSSFDVTEAQFEEHHFGERIKIAKQQSKDWQSAVQIYHNEVQYTLTTHIMKRQLEDLRMRLDPRTKWIHVKFEVVHPEQEVLNLSEDRQMRYPASKYHTYGTPEEVEKAIGWQSDGLYKILRKMVKASLGHFTIVGNIDDWKVFTLRVPFEIISPKMCFQVLHHHTNFMLKYDDQYVVWEPKVHVATNSFHELTVYIRSEFVPYVRETIQGLDSTMRTTENETLDFCSRCFCQDHRRLACPE